MALSAAQIESVREMVGDKTYATIESLCAEMNAAQESAMSDDIDEWDRRKNKAHLRMTGGGIDLNFDRLTAKLINRVCDRLNLPRRGGTGGIFRIGVGSGYSDYCEN